MREVSSRILIDGRSVEFTDGKYQKTGGNTATVLTFSIVGDDTSFRKYWNKEVIFYLNEQESYPFFRGRVINTTIRGEYKTEITAVDALGLLTGHDKAYVSLDDNNNVDGMTIAGAFKKFIELAKLEDIIGTDYLRDTVPVTRIKPPLRGRVEILSSITNALSRVDNVSIENLPRQNIIRVLDDGDKAQITIEVVADADTTTPIKHFDYKNNIIKFKVDNRKIPTHISVMGQDTSIEWTHTSASAAFGHNQLSVNNEALKSRAACQDYAQQIFLANLKAKYEYNLTTYEGAYLEENDVISIRDDKTEVDGNFRVIGKNIVFGPQRYKVELTINKRPPLLAEFLA